MFVRPCVGSRCEWAETHLEQKADSTHSSRVLASTPGTPLVLEPKNKSRKTQYEREEIGLK